MSEREWCAACGRTVAVHYGPDLPTCSQCGGDELDATWPCAVCGEDMKPGEESHLMGDWVCEPCYATLTAQQAAREAHEQREYAMSEDASRWRKRGL
jgi:hypothetical protein